MTASPTPWTFKVAMTAPLEKTFVYIRDTNGRCIGRFTDARDAELVVNTINQGDLHDRIKELEDQVKELEDELEGMT